MRKAIYASKLLKEELPSILIEFVSVFLKMAPTVSPLMEVIFQKWARFGLSKCSNSLLNYHHEKDEISGKLMECIIFHLQFSHGYLVSDMVSISEQSNQWDEHG